MLFELKTWTDGRVLYAGKHATVREAVEAAVGSGCDLRGCDLRGYDLRYCDLRGCDFRGCDLSGCNFRGCNLRGCDFRDCDLRGYDLRYCDLRGCDLRYCNFRDCDLRGCDFRGCDLSGCNLRYCDLRYCDFRDCNFRDCDLRGGKLAYRSHDLLAEILRRAAGDDTEKLKITGYILVCRHKCWDAFVKLAAVDPLGDWALDELAAWVQPGDQEAPDVLRKRAEKLATA